jgi:hypothetical protein
MLAKLISRLIPPPPSSAHDHLFTPFAPEGAPAHVLAALHEQYANALPGEFVPPQHLHFRALVARFAATAALEHLTDLPLRKFVSAYVACFERSEGFAFQLSLWRGDPAFRALLIQARERVIADLIAHDAAEQERRLYFNRWKECQAAALDIEGESLFALIQQMGPDDWHEIVLRWDWDHGVAELNWLTSQRTCDRATAVLALCLGAPADVAMRRQRRHSDWRRESFVRAVAARLENGFYPKAELGLALPMRSLIAFEEQLAVARATNESPWRLPDDLLIHPGRKHRPRYTLTNGRVHFEYAYWLAQSLTRY